MKKLKELIMNNWVVILTILLCLMLLRTCSMDRTNKNYVKELKEIKLELDNINQKSVDMNKLELINKKNMYEFLKLSLYDWNTVVRSATRPDDLMIKYDNEIKKINEELIKK